MNKNALIDKNKADEKGKAKVEEIKKNNDKMWFRKDESKATSGSTPEFGARSSSDN